MKLYSSLIFMMGCSGVTEINQLQKLQNRAARIVTGSSPLQMKLCSSLICMMQRKTDIPGRSSSNWTLDGLSINYTSHCEKFQLHAL